MSQSQSLAFPTIQPNPQPNPFSNMTEAVPSSCNCFHVFRVLHCHCSSAPPPEHKSEFAG